MQKKIALVCFCLIACEELSSKKAENDVVVFFRYPNRWVSHSWRSIATIRICRERMQTGARAAESLSIALFNFPIAFRVVPIAFLFPVARWHPGFRRVDGKCHFYRFLRVLTFTVNTAFLRLYFSDLTDKIPTVKVRFPRSIPTVST